MNTVRNRSSVNLLTCWEQGLLKQVHVFSENMAFKKTFESRRPFSLIPLLLNLMSVLLFVMTFYIWLLFLCVFTEIIISGTGKAENNLPRIFLITGSLSSAYNHICLEVNHSSTTNLHGIRAQIPSLLFWATAALVAGTAKTDSVGSWFVCMPWVRFSAGIHLTSPCTAHTSRKSESVLIP